MSLYPTVFVPCLSEKQAERAVGAAAPAAEALGSLVVGCHGTPPPHVAVPAVYPLESGAHVQEIIDAVAKANESETASIRESFVKACRTKNLAFAETANLEANVSSTWRGPTGLIPDVYVNEAMTCDLTLVAQGADTAPADETSIYTSILMGSGKPLLVIPAQQSFTIPEEVVIGWNGSLEISRAVQAALPLLKEARKVTLVSVGSDDVTAPEIPAMIESLTRHGVRATHDQVGQSGRTVSDTLQDYALQGSASLLILGGYSHSRLREMVLGGVTRSVLQEAKLPIFLSH